MRAYRLMYDIFLAWFHIFIHIIDIFQSGSLTRSKLFVVLLLIVIALLI